MQKTGYIQTKSKSQFIKVHIYIYILIIMNYPIEYVYFNNRFNIFLVSYVNVST